MQVENVVVTTRPLFSVEREFDLGERVSINIGIASEPMIVFLQEEYQKEPDCLIGDIRTLLYWKSSNTKS